MYTATLYLLHPKYIFSGISPLKYRITCFVTMFSPRTLLIIRVARIPSSWVICSTGTSSSTLNMIPRLNALRRFLAFTYGSENATLCLARKRVSIIIFFSVSLRHNIRRLWFILVMSGFLLRSSQISENTLKEFILVMSTCSPFTKTYDSVTSWFSFPVFPVWNQRFQWCLFPCSFFPIAVYTRNNQSWWRWCNDNFSYIFQIVIEFPVSTTVHIIYIHMSAWTIYNIYKVVVLILSRLTRHLQALHFRFQSQESRSSRIAFCDLVTRRSDILTSHIVSMLLRRPLWTLYMQV